MKKIFSRTICLLLAALLVLSLLAGCGAKKESTGSSAQPAPAGSPASSAPNVTATYPLKSDAALTCWAPLQSNLATVAKSVNETEFYKELEKKTGVKVTYTHPATGSEKESFNLMLASGDLPDMIETNWITYPGGPSKALKDGYVVELNSIIDKYSPNLKKLISSDKELEKMLKTDEGKFYVYPFVRGVKELLVFQGPFIRKDWLDDLGLQRPETIDEWYTVLKAFKEKKNAAAPLTMQLNLWPDNNSFVGAYGTANVFYLENNKVIYGPIQPGYKEFLTTFRKWYADGVLDKDLPTVDVKAQDNNIVTGRSGATVANAGGSLGKYLELMAPKDPKFNLVPTLYPTLKKGETARFGQSDTKYAVNGSVAITSKCKNQEIAAKWLDYGYSEEGLKLFNFGIENVSYKMENGYPKYTDVITKNPKGYSMAQAMPLYFRASYNGPFVQDLRYLEQYQALPQQKEALNIWTKTEQQKYVYPRFATPTIDESREVAKIMSDVNTAKDEFMLKCITGNESPDNFDKFVSNVKNLGIDKVIKIYQDALDRYNKR